MAWQESPRTVSKGDNAGTVLALAYRHGQGPMKVSLDKDVFQRI